MAHNFDELGILDLESREKVTRQASVSCSDSDSESSSFLPRYNTNTFTSV